MTSALPGEQLFLEKGRAFFFLKEESLSGLGGIWGICQVDASRHFPKLCGPSCLLQYPNLCATLHLDARFLLTYQCSQRPYASLLRHRRTSGSLLGLTQGMSKPKYGLRLITLTTGHCCVITFCCMGSFLRDVGPHLCRPKEAIAGYCPSLILGLPIYK